MRPDTSITNIYIIADKRTSLVSAATPQGLVNCGCSNLDGNETDDGNDPCGHYQHVGPCRFGDDCKNEHIGEAGSLRHLHFDEDGVCLYYKKGDCNRGAEWKFDHPEGAPAEQGVVQARPAQTDAPKRFKRPEAQNLEDTSESDTSSDDGWRIQY